MRADVITRDNQPGNSNKALDAAAAPDGRAWIPAVSISLDESHYLEGEIDAGPTTTTLLNVIGDHALFSGTSMAPPHASRVAALMATR